MAVSLYVVMLRSVGADGEPDNMMYSTSHDTCTLSWIYPLPTHLLVIWQTYHMPCHNITYLQGVLQYKAYVEGHLLPLPTPYDLTGIFPLVVIPLVYMYNLRCTLR